MKHRARGHLLVRSTVHLTTPRHLPDRPNRRLLSMQMMKQLRRRRLKPVHELGALTRVQERLGLVESAPWFRGNKLDRRPIGTVPSGFGMKRTMIPLLAVEEERAVPLHAGRPLHLRDYVRASQRRRVVVQSRQRAGWRCPVERGVPADVDQRLVRNRTSSHVEGLASVDRLGPKYGSSMVGHLILDGDVDHGAAHVLVSGAERQLLRFPRHRGRRVSLIGEGDFAR